MSLIRQFIKTAGVISALVFFAPSQAQTGPWELCLDHMPPRQIVVDGKEPVGRNVDVVKAFSKEMGFSLTYTPSIPFNRCIRYMEDGKTDLMMALVDTPQRRPFMAFIPISKVSKRRLFSLSENQLKITQLDDVRGLKIGMVKHYSYFKTLAPKMKTALVFNLSTLEEGFELLLKNKLDAVVATDHIGKYLAELYVNRGKIVWSELEIISTKTSNLAISKKSPAIKHLEAFKKAAQKLAKAGAFDIPQIN